MKEPDDLNHVVICHTAEHNMAWVFARSMGLFGLLACLIAELCWESLRMWTMSARAALEIRYGGILSVFFSSGEGGL